MAAAFNRAFILPLAWADAENGGLFQDILSLGR